MTHTFTLTGTEVSTLLDALDHETTLAESADAISHAGVTRALGYKIRAARDADGPPKSAIYKRLSAALVAMDNSKKSGNTEWFDRWTESIEKMMRYAPSGGGFDAGTKIDMDKTNSHKLVFNTSYHHMDEHGGYGPWTEHVVTVTPDFGGFDMKISGPDRNDIKEYIADSFDTFLRTETND